MTAIAFPGMMLPGTYDVVVTNPDGQVAEITSTVTLLAP